MNPSIRRFVLDRLPLVFLVTAMGVALAAPSLHVPSVEVAVSIVECRPGTTRTDEVLERFARSESDERLRVPGLNSGTVGEARPLTAAQDAAACQLFNDDFSSYITETQSGGTLAYDVGYYKWRGYYVAALALRPSDDPGSVVVGLDMVFVSNEQLEEVAGLAM